MADPLRDLTDGRPRRMPDDLRTTVEVIVVVLVLWIGGGIWWESTQTPRHFRQVRWGLARAGFADAVVERDRFHSCRGKGNLRVRWKTARAEGYACSYYRGTPYPKVVVTRRLDAATRVRGHR